MPQGAIVKIRDNIHEVCAMYILPWYNGARHTVRAIALAISDSLQPCGLYGPPGSSVHSPGKNTGVACHALLQGTFPTPGIEPMSLLSPALAGEFYTTSALNKERPLILPCLHYTFLAKALSLIESTESK